MKIKLRSGWRYSVFPALMLFMAVALMSGFNKVAACFWTLAILWLVLFDPAR